MRVPVRPPTRPVATTGTSSAFSARATLIPFPPAAVNAALARCRWPSWKFGTVSDLSSAALSVTVMIKSRDPGPDVFRGVPRIEADARCKRGTRHRTRRDERPRGEQALALVDTDRAEPLPCADRHADRSCGDDARPQRPVDADGASRTGGGDEVERPAAVAGLGERVRPSLPDHAPDTVSTDAPPEQRRQVGVPLLARRAAEDRRVHADARPSHSCDLAPARGTRVAGLDAAQAGERAEQVVPRVEHSSAGDVRGAEPHHPADGALVHEDPREPR